MMNFTKQSHEASVTADSLTDLFTVRDAARFLKVSPNTIRRWAYDKRLAGIKIGLRGDWRFTRDELFALTQSNVPDAVRRHGQAARHAPSLDSHNHHIVQFYEDDAYLLKSVREFIEAGEGAVVIATPEHRAYLEHDLVIGGKSLKEAIEAGLYVSYDAEETLALFMVGDAPDPQKFFAVIGAAIERMSPKEQQVHAFGEMVALLWQRGNAQGAIRLEELWNVLLEERRFTLFCAYPMQVFGSDAEKEAFARMCDAHTRVMPAESYAGLASEDERMRETAVLQQKARSLEGEVRKSRLLERQKDDFLAVASHELKTPVTSIKAYEQMLLRKFVRKGDTGAAELVSKMDAQIEKLTRLIDDLLDVSKIQSGVMRFEEKAFDSNEMVSEVISEMQSLTPFHSIVADLAPPVTLFGDRGRVSQVLMNLLSNAIKYSRDSDNILVTTETTRKTFTVHVHDFGIGISKEDQQHVFERFYRSSEGILETYPGLGLGLHISNEIIKRQEGKIWVKSSLGMGSTFSFSLPLHRSLASVNTVIS